MIVLIDNYDSFAANLARYFCLLGQEVRICRNDRVDAADIDALGASSVVLSPGPCTPDEAGNSLEIVRALHRDLPMLGICLGHQTIAAALGADIVRAKVPMHGRTSLVEHDDSCLFADVPKNFEVCRYHSLVVDPGSLPRDLQATAHTRDGSVMAFQHEWLPLFGLQFHPESILTQHGLTLLQNFLTKIGAAKPVDVSGLAEHEYRPSDKPAPPLPDQPVTF